jgi:hypothetical protein
MSDIYGPRRTPYTYPTGHGPYWQRCAAPGCGDVGEPPRHQGQPTFCAHHSCKKTNCGAARAGGSAYCLRHACDITTCPRSKLDTSAFCNQHACQYSGCKSSKRGSMTVEGGTSIPLPASAIHWRGTLAIADGFFADLVVSQQCRATLAKTTSASRKPARTPAAIIDPIAKNTPATGPAA